MILEPVHTESRIGARNIQHPNVSNTIKMFVIANIRNRVIEDECLNGI